MGPTSYGCPAREEHRVAVDQCERLDDVDWNLSYASLGVRIERVLTVARTDEILGKSSAAVLYQPESSAERWKIGSGLRCGGDRSGSR